MLDDPLLELFLLDVVDGYPTILASPPYHGPRPLAAPDIAVLELLDYWAPIRGGGFPDVWNNFNDIIGGASDLLSKLRDMFTHLYNAVWQGIGGAIRWLWNASSYAFTVTYNKVSDLAGTITSAVGDSLHWLWGLVQAGLGDVESGVTTGVNWVWDQVQDGLSWLWGLVSGTFDTVLSGLETIGKAVVDGGVWVLQSLGTAITDMTGAFLQAVTDSANWIVQNVVQPVFAGFEDIGGVFKDGFDALGTTLENAALTVGKAIRDAFEWLLAHSLEPIADTLAGKLAIPQRMLNGEFATVQDFVSAMMDPPAAVTEGFNVFIYAICAIVSAITGFSPIFAPMNNRWTQAYRRDFEHDGLLSRSDVVRAKWLGLEGDFDDELAKAGFADWQRTAIAQIEAPLASAGDLGAMAARGVFDDRVAERLGFDAAAPAEYLNGMVHLGYSEQLIDRYWRAHFVAPESSQVFDMYRRLPDQVTLDDVRAVLIANGIPPLWQDRMLQVAYQPLSRVDLRRIFQMKIINRDQVKLGYEALGYNAENAEYLTQYTQKWAFPDDGQLKDFADMTASTIRDGYKAGIIDRQTAEDYLIAGGLAPEVAEFELSIDDVAMGIDPTANRKVAIREITSSVALQAYDDGLWDRPRTEKELEDLGYLPAEADLLIQLEDIKQQQALQDVQVKTVEQRYKQFELDDAGAAVELKGLNVSPAQQQLYLLTWQGERKTSTRKLTAAQVMTANTKGQMTDEEALNYLISLGYSADDANIYMAIQGKQLDAGQIVAAWRRGLMSQAQALTGLERIGLSKADAQILMEVSETPLSQSEIVQGWRTGKISEADAMKGLEALGLSEQDARTILSLAPLTLNSTQIVDAWKKGQLADADALSRLEALGYSEDDASVILGLVALPLNVSQVIKAWQGGELTDADAILRLELLGYSEDDATIIMESNAPATAAA